MIQLKYVPSYTEQYGQEAIANIMGSIIWKLLFRVEGQKNIHIRIQYKVLISHGYKDHIFCFRSWRQQHYKVE